MSTHENEVYLHNKYEQFKEAQSGFDRAVILNELRNFGLEDGVKEMIEDWWEERGTWLEEHHIRPVDVLTDDEGVEYFLDTYESGTFGEDDYRVDTKRVDLPDHLNVEYWSKLATKPKEPMEEETIVCDCNDPSCPKEGLEGEVGGHIEECTCADCHRAMGKISG